MSDSKNGRARPESVRGKHSLEEILSQPQCWSNCLKELERPGSLQDLSKLLDRAAECLFVGCGSSFYVAMCAAAGWSAITGRRARALPASEILLFLDVVLPASQHIAAVVISRSGRTSEAVQAARLLEARGIRTLAVTCAGGQPLEHAASSTLLLEPADERSTVMTRSFSSMLLGLEYLAASLAGDNALTEELRKLPSQAEMMLKKLLPRITDFVQHKKFADYVCLGQGPLYGIACESALKITEMSVSYAQVFHTLEFRHGPKSVVGPETLVIFLFSETGYGPESAVLEEIKSLAGTTLSIANFAEERVRRFSDLLVELKLDIPEIARLAPYVFAGQLLGLYTGLRKGFDPDHPRNLTRVVTLEEKEESQQAAR